MTSNEDFLFAQEALAQGFVTEPQVEEGLLLQRRMAEDLKLDERLGVILVKRGYLAEDQARRVYARIQPSEGGPGQIHGYRLLDVVGRGAMGTVYRAVHLGLNREVAIKILRPDLVGDATQVERLRAEAAMLASLDHPNIVRALDAGESNGFPYVVMEFVEGETLRDRLRREGALPEAEALRIARALADALERARRMGVVHRDVKPGNVLMTRAGQPKLMDLGLAKGPIDLGLTQHGATVGTPQYIAPEQAVDPRKADTRSDIYALGATLYAMLTGRPPFDGQTLAEILTKVLYEVPTPVRTLKPEVSPETGYLVERMMLRDPSLRYRTPALVVADIDRLTQGTSILPPGFSGNWEAWLLRRRVRRTALLSAGSVLAALVVAVAVAGVQAWQRSSRLRTDVEGRIAAMRFDLAPAEGRAELAARLGPAEDLLRDARRTGSGRVGELSTLVRDLSDQLGRFDRLDDLVRETVDPALARGDFAGAAAALADFREKNPVYGPVARALGDRSRELVRASDDALLEDRRERAFPADPRDLEDVRAAAGRWRDRVQARYAATPLQKEELRAAKDALEASIRIAQGVRDALATVSDETIDRGVAELRLATLKADVQAARAAAETVLRDQGPALVGPERRYVAASRLAALVTGPFDRRQAALEERVRRAWRETAARARAASDAGDPAEALALLDRCARAAGEQAAFPEVAQEARAFHDQLEARTREAVGAAETALAGLARAVVKDLRAGALDDLEEKVEAARRSEALRPVASAVEPLSQVAPALRGLRARVIDGLLAHVGTDRSSWIDSLQLRGAAAAERQCEILSVARDEGTFTFRTRRGGAIFGPFTRAVDDLSEDDQLRLAGVPPEGPEGFALRALHGLATLPVEDENFYVAIPALQAVVDRFSRAGDERSALSAWAQRLLAEREAEAGENEAAAASHLKSARDAMGERRYSESFLFFRTLVDPAEEPTLRLPYTKVARDNAEYVALQMRRIRVEFHVQDLELVLPGVKVTRRGSPDGAGAADALDVDLTFDFDRKVQLENFKSGWARLVGAGQGRVLTPNSVAEGMSLRLNPDGDGEVVRDRPLVLDCPFASGQEMSATLWLWPETPVFFAIDLCGAQVGILSADPRAFPTFPPDVPLLERERVAPRFDVYGRGRGVMFRAGVDFGEPDRWGWHDDHEGRHFVPPEVDRAKMKEGLATRFFGFAHQERPYKVRFVRTPDKGVRLEVDDRDVWQSDSAALRAPRASEKIQFLTFTPCLIDDLVLSGRIDSAWLERRRAELSLKPAGTPKSR